MAVELTIELNLLHAATQWHVLPTVPLNPTPLVCGLNWHHVIWLARREGMLLLLDEMIKETALSDVCPSNVKAQLRTINAVSQLRSLERARDVCVLQGLLDQHEIPAIPIDHLTGGRCEHRTLHAFETGSALHCIVPGPAVPHARAILSAAGYPLAVDPEKLVQRGHSPVMLNEGLGAHSSAHRFWDQSSLMEVGGRKVRRLSHAHWLLVRTPRRVAIDEIPLGRICEVVSLSQQVPNDEWANVLAEADYFQSACSMAATILACHHAIDIEAPAPLGEFAKAMKPAAISAPEAPGGSEVRAPFLPTPPSVVRRMLEVAETRPNDRVYDLGCGDGRIAIAAAKDFGAYGIGIDRDPTRIKEATEKAFASGVHDNVQFECGDLFETDLHNATIVTCYLLPQLQPPLLEKLRREAKPGTRIVSHDFIFPDWPPEKAEIIRTGPLKVSHIYLWTLP